MTKRKTNWAWTKHKKEFRARCKATNAPCWLAARGQCRLNGDPINYNAPPLSKDAFESDHIIAVAVRPDLEYDPNNLAASHCHCNRSRQDRPVMEGRWQPANW